jgi:hypothetical protein
MPLFWIRRTGFLVIVLPLTLIFVAPMTHANAGPTAQTLAAVLGGEGAILALATFTLASVAAYKEIKEPRFTPAVGLDSRLKLWGFAALGIYFLSWIGMIAWLVV